MSFWTQLSRRKKALAIAALVLITLASLAYTNRATLIVKAVGIIQKMN